MTTLASVLFCTILLSLFIDCWCFCLWGISYTGNYIDTNIVDLSCPMDVTMTRFQANLYDKPDAFNTCCVATGKYY